MSRGGFARFGGFVVFEHDARAGDGVGGGGEFARGGEVRRLFLGRGGGGGGSAGGRVGMGVEGGLLGWERGAGRFGWGRGGWAVGRVEGWRVGAFGAGRGA